MMNFSTADLCDRYVEARHLHIAEPIFRAFGGISCFSGPVTTIKTFEDNVLLESTLAEPGEGRVLVVDGGGSHRCALVGSRLASLAYDNGWAGLIVYGCIRDTRELAKLPIGICALHAHPLKSHKRGVGDRDVLITVAGVNFRSGNYVYVDDDGIVVSDDKLV
jgi:regulator of ribonuclease activity A